MTKWMTFAEVGLVEMNRIVAVGRADSAPMQRLIQQTAADRIVMLTGGRRRQSVLVLDSGHLVITAVCINELLQRLEARNLK